MLQFVGLYLYVCLLYIFSYLEARGRGWPAHEEKEETSDDQVVELWVGWGLWWLWARWQKPPRHGVRVSFGHKFCMQACNILLKVFFGQLQPPTFPWDGVIHSEWGVLSEKDDCSEQRGTRTPSVLQVVLIISQQIRHSCSNPPSVQPEFLRTMHNYGLGCTSSTSSNPWLLKAPMDKSIRIGLIGKQETMRSTWVSRALSEMINQTFLQQSLPGSFSFRYHYRYWFFYIVFKVKQTVSTVQPCWVRCEGGRPGDRRLRGGSKEVYSKLPLLGDGIPSVLSVPSLLAATWSLKSEPFLPCSFWLKILPITPAVALRKFVSRSEMLWLRLLMSYIFIPSLLPCRVGICSPARLQDRDMSPPWGTPPKVSTQKAPKQQEMLKSAAPLKLVIPSQKLILPLLSKTFLNYWPLANFYHVVDPTTRQGLHPPARAVCPSLK